MKDKEVQRVGAILCAENKIVEFLGYGIYEGEEVPPEKGMWLSEEVHNELKKTIESGNQALFFLNRRGFAPYVFCNSCYKKILCQNCDVGLVYHKKIDNLICHHCGYKSSLENNKKNCK